MTNMSLRAVLGAFVLAGCAAALTGCGINPETALSSSPETGSLGQISGHAFGGQQPIAGAHVYVYATGTGGYATLATSLLNANSGTGGSDSLGYYVTTNSNGGFQINATDSCTAGTQAYLYILGGNPGFGTNSAAALLAPLGACASGAVSPPSAVVQANEISTVVTAYALAGFAANPRKIAAANTTLSATGIANAMSTALNIFDLASGTVKATSATGNAVLPVAEIYTLANALAACINSSGPSSTGCQSLFTDTGTSTDTAAAAIAIAHAPFTHVTDLFNLGTSSSAPFSPTLGIAPADFTLALQYKTPQYGTGATVNYSAAFDSGGNLWTRGTNAAGTTATFAKYGPTGAQIATQTVLSSANPSSPYIQIGIDNADNVWSGTLGGEVKLSSTGAVTTLGAGSCSIPSTETLASTVFGTNIGTAYVGDLASTHIWEFSSTACSGKIVATSPATFSGYLAVASNGDVVTAGASGNNSYLYWYNGSGTLVNSFTAGGQFLSTDASNNVWAFSTVATPTFDQLNQYNYAGSLATGNAFYQGGLVQANTVSTRAGQDGAHIDGAGAGWVGVTPCTGSCVNQPDIIAGVTSTGAAITPSTGLALPYSETGAHALALDGSGNLWVAVTDGALIQYVGLTTPVATPVLYGQLGVRP